MPKTASNTSRKDSKYKALLQLPQWQKKRLEVLEAAGWKRGAAGDTSFAESRDAEKQAANKAIADTLDKLRAMSAAANQGRNHGR